MAIPNETVLMHHMGDVAENIPMGFKAEDFAHLAGILDGLYSEPIAACVREYSTNAWDSHVLSGNLSPIEITLPTLDHLTFTVQDYGLGMSVDDLRETYSMYGRSDKRDTNAVAGQLGLGSKSGLSYAEGFTVTGIKNHEKVVALVTKDEHGLGVIKVLAPPAATDEPNGVRIQIPVDRYDVDDFRSAATHLFQFWSDGSVLIDGEPPAAPGWLATSLRLDEHTWVIRNDAGLNRSYVVMGNVPYPVSDATVTIDGNRSITRRFVAHLNMGDVDFAPSREEVKHTRHTDATLADLAAYVSTTFPRALSTARASTTSRWAETMLRTLWAGRNASLKRPDRDRSIWSFDPKGWGRKTRAHQSYSFADLTQPKTVVIIGFTAKNISATAKERLVEYAPSASTFVILPATTQGIIALDGRPNTFTWDEIVGGTAKPKAPKGQRAPKVETLYAIANAPSMTAADLANLTGTVLYAEPNEHLSHGTLGATVVMLYSSAQLPRITRYVPHIAPYRSEVDRQRKAAIKAVTRQDRLITAARTLPSVFQALDPAKVDDDDLADYIRMSKVDPTPTMEAANKFGHAIEHTPLPDYDAKYPLLSNGRYYNHCNAPMEDQLLYLNAKFAASQAALTQQVAS